MISLHELYATGKSIREIVYKIVTDYPKKSCCWKLGISRFGDRLYRERQA